MTLTLRRRTFTYLTLLLVGMIIILFLILQQIVLSSFETVEREQIMRNVWRVHYALEGAREDMVMGLLDWSSWDDSYRFVQNRDTSFVEENFTEESSPLDYLHLSFMIFLNDEGNERYWYHQADFVHMETIRATLVGTMNPAIHEALLQASPGAVYLVVDGVPMMVAVRPILKNNGDGPAVGWLIWGRILDADAITQLSGTLRLDIRIDDANSSAEAGAETGRDRWITATENEIIGGLTMSALGSDLKIEVHQPREILQQARLSVWQFTVLLGVFGGVLVVSALFLLDRLMLVRVKNLSDAVKLVGKDNFTPIPVEGRDELSGLTNAINAMLEDMTQSRQALQGLNSQLEERVAQRTVELAAQQAQLRAMVDTMGEGLIYNVDGLMAVVNPALAEMVGYSTEELIGKPFKTLTPKTDTASYDLPNKPDRYDTHLVRRDGSTLEVAITATPVFMQDGKRRRVIIVRDITQEAAMKRQKDYFFARASHELRTPLSNIMTRLYLLERDPGQGAKHLGVLNKVSRQMLTLLNDLLSVARLENGLALDKRSLELQDVLRDVVEIQRSDAEMKRIMLTANLPDMPLNVYGDATRINQIFTNLVRNAVIYTPEDGRIEVSADLSEDRRSVIVRVSDNGIGIEPAHLPRLFDPFFRATEGGVGAGLGLYITREIIDLHGGSIQVESTPGIGTTFCVFLTLHKEPKPILVS